MDFFKTCRSNVLLIEGVSKTAFRVFRTTKAKTPVDTLIRGLREAGILCTLANSQLWIFGIPDAEGDTATKLRNTLIEDEAVTEERSGTLDTTSPQESVDSTPVTVLLLDAIEGAISYRLAKDSGAIHIGPCTWLLSGGPDDTGFLLRLNMDFTEANALYATTTIDISSLVAIDIVENAADEPLILAPVGKSAQLVLDEKPQTGPAIAAQITQATRVGSGAFWKAFVTDLLSSEGLELDGNELWIPVRPSGDFGAEIVSWPKRFIFRQRDMGSLRYVPRRAEPSWKYWFIIPGEDNQFRNPLSIAEEWFTGAADRERATMEGTKSHETHSMDTAMPYSGADTDNVLAISPPFAQRNVDQQVAIGGIYPTPPDGLVPGSQPLHNIESVMASAQPEPSGLSIESAIPNDAQPSIDQVMESPNAAQAFQSNNDDLFGDMDGMDFAGEEVGDADFSFFDEPDEEALPGEQHNADAMEVAPTNDEPTVAVEQSPTLDLQTSGGQALPTTQDLVKDTGFIAADSEMIEDSPLQHGHLVRPGSETSPPPLEEKRAKKEPEKPLSPFGVKERLLPPPIPASVKQTIQNSSSHNRRSSTFDPVVFRESVDLGQKYAAPVTRDRSSMQSTESQGILSISLPSKRKKPRIKRPPDTDSDSSDQDDESEEDSYESASSMSDENLPPKLPWDTKKRKRSTGQDTNQTDRLWPEPTTDDGSDTNMEETELSILLHRIMSNHSADTQSITESEVDDLVLATTIASRHNGDLPPTESLLQLSTFDMVYTAQLICEQALSCTSLLVEELALITTDFRSDWSICALASQNLVENVIRSLLPAPVSCAISELALIKEPVPRQVSVPGRPGQPRPVQRLDTGNLGPDFHMIPPPYVRVQRGIDTFEMLPPALDFWETLSLSPSNGPKDVRAFCIYPSSDELRHTVDVFLGELGAAYESCKLGSHVHVRNMNEDLELDDYEDGLVPVDLAENDNLESTLRAYSSICADLGSLLAEIAHLECERTFVVYMVNPFTHSKATHHLCACFWLLYEVYRGNLAKIKDGQPRSDIVLQLLPIELIAAYEAPVILDTRQMGILAKETYDRCPPSTADNLNKKSATPGFAAPFVELASIPPRRINFQLTAEPPSDLMHEPSILHLAYATSQDGEWLTATWVDNIGRNQSSLSLCIRGKCFADVAEDVWTRTREIMAVREVTWRIFVVSADPTDASIQQCWRKLIAQPRKHLLHVTFLAAHLEPSLKLIPPQPVVDDALAAAGGAHVLTPASTPQGTTPFTFSPDASSHTAPPTPAPTDPPAALSIVENDPDAHLVDFADETWAVLFSPAYARASSSHNRRGGGGVNTTLPPALATGALFKRGEPSIEHCTPPAALTSRSASTRALPALRVALQWTVQVRPNANVDEGNVKQAEGTLREALRMYRNLSVLTRARGLACGGDGRRSWGVMPVHLVAALRGVEGLDGLLS